MKTNRTLIILAIALICICFAIVGIGYIYISSQPPSTLTNNSGYYIRWSKVYYLGGFPSTAFELEGADADSFVILDEAETYALDDSQVYFNGRVIPAADPATFEVLESWFSRDANHVYMSGNVFTDDPANFEILDHSLYRDSQHIYWGEKIISNDPTSLEIIFDEDHYTYIKDSQIVFVNGNPINGADLATFEVLAPGYSRDADQVYYFDQAMSADPTTFEVLESPYSRDSEKVFWMEHQIPNADAQTFRVLNANFECSADSQTAFYQDQPVPNFDSNTIPSDSQVTNCDSNGMYFSP